MAAPPVPPRPNYDSPPHFDNPLVAPRPHKLDPSIPANMARSLDDQLNAYHNPYRGPSPVPPPPPLNYNPSFPYPEQSRPLPTPVGPPPQAQTQPWYPKNPPLPPSLPYPGSTQPSVTFQSPPQQHQLPPPQVRNDTLSPAMAALSFNNPRLNSPPRTTSSTSPSPPTLTTPLPSIQSLTQALPVIQNPSNDPSSKIAWCRDVVFLLNRSQQLSSSSDTPTGPIKITDPALQRLMQTVVPLILQLSQTQSQGQIPAYVAEAVYLRATFEASGAFPEYVTRDPRLAFRDYEAAARAGYAGAWFKLGRDYEGFNDFGHAVECYERGVKLGVESSCYRMGMAHLMGQLGLAQNFDLAIPLLLKAATLATIDVPQPAYVFGLLLLSEFTQVTVPARYFNSVLPPGTSLAHEARKHLERAAFLNFGPAQYKLGHAYEFAEGVFPFDALMSVQYYSLASQQGEVEADMALSKWFLCGSGDANGPGGGGGFEKDEGLAYTFAEKAARRGLPSAEFAMGYYAEVGVGRGKDVDVAIKWYTRAAEGGNEDARERLRALSGPSAQSLSRREHDMITESKLMRTRTQAQQRSSSLPKPSGRMPVGEGRRIVEGIRKNSVMYQEAGPGTPVQTPQGPGTPQTQGGEGYLQGPLRTSPSSSPRPQLQQVQQVQQQGGYGLGGRGGQRSSVALSDTGPTGKPGPGRTNSPGRVGPGRTATAPQGPGPQGPPQGGPQGPGGGSPPQIRVNSKPSKGPTTFAEMGFVGAKAEDKECVIM